MFYCRSISSAGVLTSPHNLGYGNYCWSVSITYDKTTLRIGCVQFFVQTNNYALVFSPWATRPPTGHGLVEGGHVPPGPLCIRHCFKRCVVQLLKRLVQTIQRSLYLERDVMNEWQKWDIGLPRVAYTSGTRVLVIFYYPRLLHQVPRNIFICMQGIETMLSSYFGKFSKSLNLVNCATFANIFFV